MNRFLIKNHSRDTGQCCHENQTLKHRDFDRTNKTYHVRPILRTLPFKTPFELRNHILFILQHPKQADCPQLDEEPSSKADEIES